MNVGYKELSASDVARMLGLDKTTVAGWCRQNLINFSNVGEGTQRQRYLISEEEAEYLRTLSKKFGKRKIMSRYRKDWKKGKEPAQTDAYNEEEITKVPIDERPDLELIVKTSEPEIEKYSDAIKYDEDKLLNAVLHIREVKERINNLNAELAQLENEYKELKQDIMDWL